MRRALIPVANNNEGQWNSSPYPDTRCPVMRLRSSHKRGLRRDRIDVFKSHCMKRGAITSWMHKKAPV